MEDSTVKYAPSLNIIETIKKQKHFTRRCLWL